MSTYIDMLRAHQAKLNAASSQREKGQEADDDNVVPGAMLQDESEHPPVNPEAEEDFGAVSLLADEGTGEAAGPAASDTGEAADVSMHAWLSACVALLVRIYEDAARNVPTDISPLLLHLSKFTTQAYNDPEELNALELDIANRIETIRHSHAACGDLVQKAVMMMLYGIKVCVQMRMEPQEITRYVAAAMLHNIGMAQILVEVRLKEGELSGSERELIRKVPEASEEYLKRCGVSDRVLLHAAQQAQERHDGSGPRGLSGTDIALSARIVGLLSMFEALVHVRTYRERLLPRDAIRELVNRHKSRFDPIMLKVLIESVSLYPVGTYIQLNSGDVGQVVRIQPRLPLRPKVILSMDRHGNKIQAREVDLRKQPNLMVQRCMYAEALASLKQEKEAG